MNFEVKKVLEAVRGGEMSVEEALLKIKTEPFEDGQEMVLITRLSKEKAEIIRQTHELTYYDDARIGILGEMPLPDGIGKIVVATGGTSDVPVAEEAALTAQAFGNEVVRLYDVGVAGVHRLLAHREEIMNASVIIAIAGMEGAPAALAW